MEETNLKLTLLERVEILGRFPREGGIKTLMVYEDLTAKLRFTQEEMTTYEILDKVTVEGGLTVNWNEAGSAYIQNIVCTDLELKELKILLETLDKSNTFPITLLGVYKQLEKLTA